MDPRPTMPLGTMAEFLVQDPSEGLYGPDTDGADFSGYGGGELDTESGVLTLTFTPHKGQETGSDPQDYAPTTVRFVEVEKLLDVLKDITAHYAQLGATANGIPRAWGNRPWWREVLAGKLDTPDL